MSIEDIITCIQGKPEIDKVLIQDVSLPTRIGSEQTEDASDKESTVFYDIRFTATVPSGENEVIELIINLETQNDFHPGYPLLKRGIYYCSRMISSQYGTVFVKSDYGKIKKVYSIWVCTNPSQEMEYAITRYKMMEENIEGKVKAKKANYDLLDIVIICLGSKMYTSSGSPVSLLANGASAYKNNQGGSILDTPSTAQSANPLTYIGKNTPPFLIMHGNADTTISPSQSKLLYDALAQNGIYAEYYVVDKGEHRFKYFVQPKTFRIIVDFLNRVL